MYHCRTCTGYSVCHMHLHCSSLYPVCDMHHARWCLMYIYQLWHSATLSCLPPPFPCKPPITSWYSLPSCISSPLPLHSAENQTPAMIPQPTMWNVKRRSKCVIYTAQPRPDPSCTFINILRRKPPHAHTHQQIRSYSKTFSKLI